MRWEHVREHLVLHMNSSLLTMGSTPGGDKYM